MTASIAYYESCTRLRPGMAGAYEEFHRAVPQRVDESLRRAGVLGWKIYLRDEVLTHCVFVQDRSETEALLDGDPTSPWWLAQANQYLVEGSSPEVKHPLGRLIWDLDWPTREEAIA